MNFYEVYINQVFAVSCCEWSDVKRYLTERGTKFAFVTCGDSQWNVWITRNGSMLKSSAHPVDELGRLKV